MSVNLRATVWSREHGAPKSLPASDYARRRLSRNLYIREANDTRELFTM